MSKSDPVVVIVGTGFGCRIQVPAFRGAGFEVAGLVGTESKRTQERAEANGVPQAFTDLGRAVLETGAGVVAVSTPPHTHGAIVAEALSHGCHVLCEKPFARDLEARRMRDAARQSGKICLLGNEFRFVPQRAAIARAIAEGAIGEPRLASFVQYADYVTRYEADIPDWWFDPAQGGGWLGASGSHAVDQVRSWLGEFAAVSASLLTVSASRGPVDDSFAVRFTLRSDVEGMMQQTSAAFGGVADFTRIAGTEGTIWTDGMTIRHADRNGVRDLPVPDDLILPPPPPLSGDPRHARAEWQMMAAAELAPYTRLCETLKAAVTDGASLGPVVPADFGDGVANMAVLDAIRASASARGEVVEIGADAW